MLKKSIITVMLLISIMTTTACGDDTSSKATGSEKSESKTVEQSKETGEKKTDVTEKNTEITEGNTESETTVVDNTEVETTGSDKKDEEKETTVDIQESANLSRYDSKLTSCPAGEELSFYIFDATQAIRENGAGGSGYVSYLGSGGTAEWKINAQIEGYYYLWIEYSTLEARELDFTINGGITNRIECEPTGSWFNESKGYYTIIRLNVGENSILLSNDDAYAPNIDFIGLCRVVDDNTEKYEYTDYDYNYANRTEGVSLSATGGMSWVGSSEYVLFNDIKVDSAGKYKLKLEYSSSSDGYYQIQVNNGEAVMIACKSSGSVFYDAYVTLDIELNEGYNSIKIYNETEHTPILYSIGIAPVR